MQQGFEDRTKGTIFFDIAKIIKITRPKVVFLENVQNLLSHDKQATFKTIVLTVVFGALAYPLSASIPSIVGQSVFGPKEFSAISATLMTGVYLGQALYAPVMSIFLSSSAGFEGGWKFLCGTGIATMILLLLSITTSPMKKARV